MSHAIVWFRRDLRLQDNPALHHALAQGYQVIPIYIYAPKEETPWPIGRASRWWLHHSLQALNIALRTKHSRLLFFQGCSLPVLQNLIHSTQAKAVYWNHLSEPAIITRDNTIKTALRAKGIIAQGFKADLLHEPWTIHTHAGKPYQLFTPFWRTCQRSLLSELPLTTPLIFKAHQLWPSSLKLADLKLLSGCSANEFAQVWQPGEAGAWQRLQQWCSGPISYYAEQRDFPGIDGVSRLSPHLHFGEISPRQVIGAVEYALHYLNGRVRGIQNYERQLFWREFAYYLLYHYPHTPEQPLRSVFKKFPWRTDYQKLFKAWQQGQTGYPLVDAGMRELLTTGWMHNRVRMVAAAFLTRNCAIPWQEGAYWFWEHLVDADLANNTLGWQWVAGCGADAIPYHRIFNPLLQSTRFDPQGNYLQRWLPELAGLSPQYRHRPWLAQLQLDYPSPIIDYMQSRREALDAYQHLNKSPIEQD
ncbi:MAG: deoxyribodipyrimidine photo-lyase [Thioploca sp.]|nr:deoxyribodipyrimidine photo-lyase [Thioploca sp.]